MSTHSSIGASGMHRWQNCPGSVRLSRGLPPTTNQYAEAGTRAHEIAAELLLGKKTYADVFVEESVLDVGAIANYVNIIDFERAAADYFWIEQSFSSEELHEGFYGTADACGYWWKEKLLRVYDFKYGSGHFVEVENNVQLLYYALGAAVTSELEIEQIEVAIIQPRCPRRGGKIDHRWRFGVDTLIDFALEFKRAAERTEDPAAALVEGAYCYFCPAVNICPAQHAKRNERAKEIFGEV